MMLRLCLIGLFTTLPALAAPPTPTGQALAHLRQAGSVPAGIEVAVERATHWDAGHFVRVEQRAWDLPVEGGRLTVQLDRALGVKRVIGTRLQAPSDRPEISLTRDQAIEHAKQATRMWTGEGEAWWPARAELGAWADTDGTVHLVWNVSTSRVAPLGTYQTRVDASTGKILTWAPTLHHVQGDVYPTNPDTSELETVDLLRLESETYLEGRHVAVRSCTNFSGQTCNASTRWAVNDRGDFFYEPDPGAFEDPFAEVQMYYHVDKVGQHFEDAHGFRHREPLEAIVNFEFQNAFFGDADGDGTAEIAFGQFGETDFAYDGDVVYHEFVHSVFNSVTGSGFFEADEYGIDFAPSALNEGTADLFSMVLSNDPELGEYAGKGFGLGGPIRDLEEDRRCPHNLYGQQHRDGQIWASMGWNLIEDERIGADVAGQLTYGFLEQLPPQKSWGIVGDVLAQSADDLLASGAIDQTTREAIDEHIEAAGLVACERVIPLDDGFEPRLFVAYAGFAEDPIPAAAQFSIEVPENATDLTFQVTGFQSNDPNMRWMVYARRGSFIRHDVQSLGGFIDIPVPADFDASFDQQDIGRDGAITFSLDGDNVLEPGETYYFSLAGTGEGGGFGLSQAEARVQASVTLGDPVDPGTDENDDTLDEPAGCSCDTSTPTGLAWLLALPLGLALIRRRR